jgi:hypothetical protein
MYLLLLVTPGNGADLMRTVLTLYGYMVAIKWGLPLEADMLIVEVPGVGAGRELMANLEGTLGLIDMQPVGFQADVVALAPQLHLPSKIA